MTIMTLRLFIAGGKRKISLAHAWCPCCQWSSIRMVEGSVEGELLSSVQANQTKGGVKADCTSHRLMERQDLEHLEL